MASNEELRKYRYSFDIRESSLEEDDRWDFITVKLRFWKLYNIIDDDKTVAVEVRSIWEYDIHRVEVADDYDEPILKVSSYLTELGFPESSHAVMITRLMQCIDTYIIQMRRYQHETVFMDIKELVDDESISNEALSRSIDITGSYFGNRTYWFRVNNEAWLEKADGCMVEAVWFLKNYRLSIWSDWIQVPWELLLDSEEAVTESVEEEDTPQMVVPASEAAIASLEKIEKDAIQSDTPSCKICINEDEDDDEVGFSRMPCRHVFHTLCVETWLRISSSCPICRDALPHY